MSIITPSRSDTLSIERICLDVGLYEKLAAQDDALNRYHLTRLRTGSIQFDAFCIYCNKETTFRTNRTVGGGAGSSRPENWMLADCDAHVSLFCQRVATHNYQYDFVLRNGFLQKIGQFPSLADIGAQTIKRFKPLLKDGLYGDLGRASGLFAHGVGAGSLVYLRRIFERIITDERDSARSDGEELLGFDEKRLNEKIELLSHRLPTAMQRHKKAYKLLSAGIHELDEDQCKALFPVLQGVIMLILDEHLRAKERAKEEQALTDAMVAAEKALKLS